jgi:hypothetical protein
MEFRWLTSDERRTRAVESSSLSEVLALAQNLQAEGEGLVSEEQAVEMGRELGVRAEYVHEALRLRRRAAQPAGTLPPERADYNPITAALWALLGVFSLLMLPATARVLPESGRDPVWIFVAFAAAIVAGWSARYPRLAGIAGAGAVPMILIVSSFYRYPLHLHGIRGEAILFALLSLCPLCSAVGRRAASVRRWAERFAERPRLTASTH